MLFTWWRKFLRKPSAGTRRPPRFRSYLPCFDVLDDRITPAFLVPATYAAGAAPGIMTVGDFNGDGKLDVVAANSSLSPSVSVLLNNGGGTFGAAVSSSLPAMAGSPYTGAQGHTMATADFNGDGKLDLAVICNSNVAQILLGNGDGTFQAPLGVALGPSPARISAADVNGDGHADLLAANTTGTVSVLLGHGDGTFAPAVSYAAGTDAQDVKAADLNGDGKPDLVVANAISAGSVNVLLGNGDGTFQPYTSYAAFSAPYELQVGDFNGDGHVDVVVANSYTSSYVTYLPGNGDGTLGLYHSYNVGLQPWDIDMGDFNGDGHLDLIEGNNGGGNVIEMGNGDGTFGVAQRQGGTAGNSFAAGDFNGDGFTDIAGTSNAGVTVLVNSENGLLNLAGTASLGVSAATTTTAGAPLAVTVRALDAAGNVATGYTGTVHFASSDGAAALPANYTFTVADAGTHTFLVTLKVAGTQSVSVTDTAFPTVTGSQGGVVVSPGAAASFSVGGLLLGGTNAPVFQAGSGQNVPIRVRDAFGNLVTNYTGTVAFSSSDAQASLPANYTFTAADGGAAFFPFTLRTAGLQSISVHDVAAPTVAGSETVSVSATVATTLTVSGGGGGVGAAHAVTVTARDAFGNVATGVTDLVHLASSDPATLVSGDIFLFQGVGTFQVTPMTLGTQTLTATDLANASLTGSETITGTVGGANRFVLTPLASAVAGTTQTFTVTAYDVLGDLSTVYTGTVYFSSSDAQAGLPAAYTFTAADAGSHTFSVALRTAGSQSVTVRDAANPAVTASDAGIVVTPGAAASISVTPVHGGVAGTAQTVTVTAHDAFGNVATGYTGTVAFSSSDTQAALPAAYTFTAADAGTHTFTVTFKTSGGQTFAVQDTANAANLAFNYSQRDIPITAAAVVGFALRAPSNVTAGTAFSVTVQAVDAFGNVVPNYVGTVHFTGPSGGGNLLPADYTFTAADAGSHTFSVTLVSTGTQTLGVADLANGSLKGQTSVKVATGTTSSGGGGGGGGGTATGGSGGGGTTTSGGGGSGGGKTTGA